MTPTALFIHGAWVGPACWDPFIGQRSAPAASEP